MAKGDVLKEELPTGSAGARKCEKDDFKHPNMLKSGPRNGNDTNSDGIFGRHTGSSRLANPILSDKSSLPRATRGARIF